MFSNAMMSQIDREIQDHEAAIEKLREARKLLNGVNGTVKTNTHGDPLNAKQPWRNHARKRVTAGEKRKWKALYRGGMTIVDIAKQVGRNRSVVQRYV